MTATTGNVPAWASQDTEVHVDREDRTHPQDQGVDYSRCIDQWTHYGQRIDGQVIGVSLLAFRHDQGQDWPDHLMVWENTHPDGSAVPSVTLRAEDARRLGQQLLRAADMLDGRDD